MLLSTAAAGGDSSVRAWIATEPTPQGVRIVPYAQASEARQLRYEFVSSKEGRSGRSDSRQAGQVTVDCCAPKALVRLGLSVQPGERYTLTLRVFDRDTLVAEDRVVYPVDRI
jgi:hypothetical protein